MHTHTQIHKHTKEVKRGFVGKRQLSKQEKDESVMEESDQNALDNTLCTHMKLSKNFFFFLRKGLTMHFWLFRPELRDLPSSDSQVLDGIKGVYHHAQQYQTEGEWKEEKKVMTGECGLVAACPFSLHKALDSTPSTPLLHKPKSQPTHRGWAESLTGRKNLRLWENRADPCQPGAGAQCVSEVGESGYPPLTCTSHRVLQGEQKL